MVKQLVIFVQLATALASIAIYTHQHWDIIAAAMAVIVILAIVKASRKNRQFRAAVEVMLPLIGAYVMVEIEFLGVPAAVAQIILLFVSILL